VGIYNTRESSPAINLVFSRVSGYFNNKLKLPTPVGVLNLEKSIL